MCHGKTLAGYVRELISRRVFVIHADAVHTEHICRDHVGIVLADAVLQRQANWYRVVKPRLDRIRRNYPETKTLSGLKTVLSSVSASEFIQWPKNNKSQGWCRVKVFLGLVDLLDREHIETEGDINKWIADEQNRAKLRAIHQVSDKTIDYLEICVGRGAVAVDTRISGFLEEANIPASRMSYAEKRAVVVSAAKILGIAAEILDCSIWYYRAKPEGL